MTDKTLTGPEALKAKMREEADLIEFDSYRWENDGQELFGLVTGTETRETQYGEAEYLIVELPEGGKTVAVVQTAVIRYYCKKHGIQAGDWIYIRYDGMDGQKRMFSITHTRKEVPF